MYKCNALAILPVMFCLLGLHFIGCLQYTPCFIDDLPPPYTHTHTQPSDTSSKPTVQTSRTKSWKSTQTTHSCCLCPRAKSWAVLSGSCDPHQHLFFFFLAVHHTSQFQHPPSHQSNSSLVVHDSAHIHTYAFFVSVTLSPLFILCPCELCKKSNQFLGCL